MAKYNGLRKICTRSKELTEEDDRILQLTLDPKTLSVDSSFCKKDKYNPENKIGFIDHAMTMTQIEDFIDERVNEMKRNNYVCDISFSIELYELAGVNNVMATATIYFNDWLMIKDVKIKRDGYSMLCIEMPVVDGKYVCEIIDENFEAALKNHILMFYHASLKNTPYKASKFLYETHKKEAGTNVGIQLTNKGSLKAYAHIYINNLIKVSGIKVITGKNGLFVAWPSVLVENKEDPDKPKYDKKVFPYEKSSYEAINNQILEKYKESY